MKYASNKRWLIASLVFLACAGAGCFEKVYAEGELFGMIKTLTDSAIEEENPKSCEGLPEVATYESFWPSGSSAGDFIEWPRSQCYWQYTLKTNDQAGCEALTQISAKKWSSYACYSSLAQRLGDVTLCEKMSSLTRSECRANVLKDVRLCYELPKDEHDTSKYSRSVQWCIGSVARRLRSFDPCLQIDGPDHGDQWRIGRNQCIENVAATLGLKAPELNKACEMMVDDEPGWDSKQRCLQGNVTVLGPGFD